MQAFPPDFIAALKAQVQGEYDVIKRYISLKSNANDAEMRQRHQAEIDLRLQNIAEIQASFLQQAQHMGVAEVPNAELANLIKKEVEQIMGQAVAANSSLPVVLTVFANPLKDLGSLDRERNKIQSVLLPLDDRQCKHIIRSDTSLADYFEFLKKWKNQLAIFHYGGHANSQGLKLADHAGFFSPLAKELARRNKESLQLVFLNGCSTHHHVQTLLEQGVKSVIATRVAVGDGLASDFAVQFYKNMASGDSIGEAFESTCNFMEAVQSEQGKSYRIEATPVLWRGSIPQAPEPELFPWRLYTLDEAYLDYALPPATGTQTTRTKVTSTRNKKNVYNHGKVTKQVNNNNIEGDVNL